MIIPKSNKFLLFLFCLFVMAVQSTCFAQDGKLVSQARSVTDLFDFSDIAKGIGPVEEMKVGGFMLGGFHKREKGFSFERPCVECHERNRKNLHVARAGFQCQDCHLEQDPQSKQVKSPKEFSDHGADGFCARCHEGGGVSFATYKIHEPFPFAFETQRKFPALFYSAWMMAALAGGVFLVFVPYMVLWAIREFRDLISGQKMRARHKGIYIRRFTGWQRGFHALLSMAFMVLSLTGLSWMYYETGFGHVLALPFEGYEGAIGWHRYAGLGLLALFFAHLVYLWMKISWEEPKSLLGPESIVFLWSDFKGFWEHLKWIVGAAPHPKIDRWAWWQKFDYWAIWWGMVIVGVTGALLYNPVLTAEMLPGWFLNVARWVHKIEALMAMAHIFVVHFFIESYRPRSFPMNGHIFSGAANLGPMQHEHEKWIERVKAEGRMGQIMTRQPPRPLQFVYFIFGFSTVVLGFSLFLGAFVFFWQLSF